MADGRREALLAEYSQVGDNFRMLTGIRFKLLAFLPIAAGASALLLGQKGSNETRLGVSLLGLFVTLGLITYNARNDQLYDVLVGRAAEIERCLGIPDGAFAHRPRPWFQPFGKVWAVDHRSAVATIQGASAALWSYGVLASTARIAYGHNARAIVPSWLDPLALTISVVVIVVSTRLLHRAKVSAENRLRTLAAVAVAVAVHGHFPRALASTEYLQACVELAGEDPKTIEARAHFLARLEPTEIKHFVADGSREWHAAQVTALLCDLPPEWLYDCLTGRRRHITPNGFPRYLPPAPSQHLHRPEEHA